MEAEPRFAPRAAYDELCAYTLSLRDPAFVHQHVVDAYTAHTANETTKPIGTAFALIGLCLFLERGYDGREVQRAHMNLARRRRSWPHFPVPASRTTRTARDVLTAAPGEPRVAAIRDWAAAVWADWSASHAAVRELLDAQGVHRS